MAKHLNISLDFNLKCSNAYNPLLYADIVLCEMFAYNNLDVSPAILTSSSETRIKLPPDPSLLMMSIDKTFPTVYQHPIQNCICQEYV